MLPPGEGPPSFPGDTAIFDPLPHNHVTDDPGIGGRLKARPEDFVVEELPLYEPCQEGEHLYLRIQKQSVAHGELMSCLRRAFDVPERAIGYAGMKDKHAVTFQTVSIHLPQGDPPAIEIDHARIAVLWSARHRNKLKRGHHRGNRFVIRVRNVEPTKAPVVHRVLRRMERTGVPGYFGPQRFGYRHNNHLLGAMLLARRWEEALGELLGAGGSPFPEHQRERRELYDAGRFDEAAAMWTTADRSELIAARTRANRGRARDAIMAIGRTTLSFWASSLVSAAYNRVLDRRIADGTIDSLADGDIAFKHDSRASFHVTPEVIASDDLPGRLERMEISPSGPLWGAGMMEAHGATAEIEREALAATGVDLETMAESSYGPDGGRRPLRGPIANTDVEGGFDEHGPYVRVAFDLPRGMYATVVLDEVMKNAHEG